MFSSFLRRFPRVLIIAALIAAIAVPARAARVKRFYFYPAHPVVIDNSAAGDMLVIGGDVEISGKLAGNVSVVGGDVHLNKGTVTGDVVVVGGELISDRSSRVAGTSVVFASVLKRNHTALLLISTLFWLLAIGFGFYFFPGHIRENAFEFADDFVRAILLGIYAAAVLVILSVLSFVLIQVVVGIFLLLAVAVFGIALYLFSVLTVFQLLGELIWKHVLKTPMPGLLQMVTGLIIYEALAWLGFIGLLGTLVLVLGAMGASLLSRFGTFKPWFGTRRYWGQG
ncbi:MAG: hypothetical protein GXO69_01435 [Acidobacteria bacterium]|nr:hypothetical protein [Acidobacteriota bacterium]